jgi:hypothetical protein
MKKYWREIMFSRSLCPGQLVAARWEGSSSSVYATVLGNTILPKSGWLPELASTWLVKVLFCPGDMENYRAKPVRELPEVIEPGDSSFLVTGMLLEVAFRRKHQGDGVLALFGKALLFPDRSLWEELPRPGAWWLVEVVSQPNEDREIYDVAPYDYRESGPLWRRKHSSSPNRRRRQFNRPRKRPTPRRAETPNLIGQTRVVTFEESRSETPLARIEGKIAFPGRTEWMEMDHPQAGETWEVQVAFAAANGKTLFLRPVRRMSSAL